MRDLHDLAMQLCYGESPFAQLANQHGYKVPTAEKVMAFLLPELEPVFKQRDALLAACKDAFTMADNLRRETGDAIPGGICYTLRQAIALCEKAGAQ